ncbi:MAG: GNAT family N-acetyltransferase [Planctomycetes bacterium]|nr:GNAT family N-acetyltransferase [Planctomycetota bacterium]
MSESHHSPIWDQITVRTYEPSDQQAVAWLYERGRLAGQEQPNDTAADIDNIHQAYLTNERAHFWVAVYEGRIVGMVGVAEDEPNLAEIRRLRVQPELRGQGVGFKLMETALGFCNHHGYLKVVLDTAFEQGSAMDIFDKFAFQHNRTRTIGGKDLLEFYLDLYREPRAEETE